VTGLPGLLLFWCNGNYNGGDTVSMSPVLCQSTNITESSPSASQEEARQ